MRKYQNLLLLLFVSFTFFQCKKTDWRENFKEDKKTPFGTYILFNESEELFENYENILINENMYDFLIERYLEDNRDFNYICIKNDARKLSKQGIEEILNYVYDGSNAFFSLNDFSYNLKEALEIGTKNLDSTFFSPAHLKGLKGTLSLKNNDYNNTTYEFDRNLRRNYFTKFNPKNTIVLGTQKIGSKEQPTFLKIYHGRGAIYVHTQPTVFTNYNMLKDNHAYAENVLSYLPNEVTYWDPQIRWSKISDQPKDSQSILAYFWNNPSLKWFLYIGFLDSFYS